MSDNPGSLAAALYPDGGPASGPVGPQNMSGESWRGESIANLPASADPRSVMPNASPDPASPAPSGPISTNPSDPNSKTFGDSLYGTPPQQDASTPTATTLPEGFEADPVLMGEFQTAAREMRLDKSASDRLVQLHVKAIQGMEDRHSRQTAAWESETKAHFGDSLPETVQNLRARIGSDADGREFMRLMGWSGLGNNAAVLRVLDRLARGY